MKRCKNVWIVLMGLVFSEITYSQEHPSVMLTKKNITDVREGIKQYPLLAASFSEVKATADKAIASELNVPVPKDGGGGVTHEQHKRNYQAALACGIAYQITKQAKYAEYVQDLLLEYARQYNSWPLHPKRKKEGQQAGKIFWQNLNDCVWQVYVIQGYDLVFDYIPKEKRRTIEDSLFSPIIKFLTVDAYSTFNMIHNHATWSCAAVGITGYVTGNREWSEMALKGSNKDGKTGFLKQLNGLFSPDGYYTEGPYYQRYALLPFVVFARAINQYQQELKIFETRNSVLTKAIHTALQLTYTNGAFFPINDAMKDKTFESEELVYGVDIAYADIEARADLLDIAQKQKRVIVSDAGFKVAKDIAAGKAKPFVYESKWIKDGANGEAGGLGILRAGNNADQQCVVFKATSQGMGHGHFDRLNVLYYDNNVEVFSDYGAARFLNIESKRGGEYLPENKTWAKQTIAHNTIIVDETSHFSGKLQDAEKHHPEFICYNASSPGLQVVSARENNAYPGVELIRTTALVKVKSVKKPLLIDIVKATSNAAHQYDLPFWYQGHITNIPFKYQASVTELKPLGKSSGYQHVWLNGFSRFADKSSSFITVLNNKRFYTTSFATDSNTVIKFLTSGANDPEFSLRNEKAFMLSHAGSGTHTFIAITETHGNTNPVAETTSASSTTIHSIKILSDTKEQTVFEFIASNKKHTVTINYNDKNNFIQIVN